MVNSVGLMVILGMRADHRLRPMTHAFCSPGVPKGPLTKRPAKPHSQRALRGVRKGDRSGAGPD